MPVFVTLEKMLARRSMTGKELASVDNFMKTAPHTCKSAK